MRDARPTFSEPTKITVDDVRGRLERSEPLFFIDARSPRAWEASDVKLPGALRAPAGEIEAHLGELPHDRPIVVYCT
jgi:rhodanese-related sulfurtransferase